MQSGQLQRRLGLTSAVTITVGAVIGSGIFLKPLSIAQSLPSESWIYVLWAGLGVVCLFGAFAYAELGAMFPEAGGQYAFLREGWGRGVAFLYGWVFFWVINSGTIAALAVAFAEFLLPVFGMDAASQTKHPEAVVGAAAAMVIGVAVIHHFGVVWGAFLQNLATFAKIAALGVIVAGGLVVVGGNHDVGAGSVASKDVATTLTTAGLAGSFAAIFWAYEGWYQLPFNAAELKRPERHLPFGLIAGMLVLIAVYTSVNAIYLHVVPFEEMRSLQAAKDVPALAVARIFSPQAAGYLTLLVAISVMGS